jgi:hypothetical protein
VAGLVDTMTSCSIILECLSLLVPKPVLGGRPLRNGEFPRRLRSCLRLFDSEKIKDRHSAVKVGSLEQIKIMLC